MRAIKFFSAWVFILMVGLQSAEGFTKKVKSIDGESESTGNAWSTPSSFVPASDIGMRIAKSASAGVGSGAGQNMCYRAVKWIIADALGKKRDCVKSYMPQGSAKNAGTDLLNIGFVMDKSKCNTPGAVRVYKGVKVKGIAATKGTIHGHAEVVGDDGLYHHFLGSHQPADQRMPGQRILTGCYYPDVAKISQGPMSNCPAQGFKPIRVKKKLNQPGVE